MGSYSAHPWRQGQGEGEPARVHPWRRVRAVVTTLPPEEETAFRQWYAAAAKANRLAPDPDDPRHFYDYRGYWRKLRPTVGEHGTLTEHGDFRFPDEFKLPGHPTPPKPRIGPQAAIPEAPKGFDEQVPVVSRALDILAPTGLRAAAVGEHVAEAVKDIPRAITELRREEFTGADPYAETLQRLNRSLQRGGRQARNLATILFSPFSLLLSPAEGIVTPIVGTITNLLKGVSTLDPGELKIAPEMANESFLKVLSTPGAVRTQNENLNAILDEAGGILPFVLAGGVISRARVHPWRPTPGELRVPARPVEPGVIYTPERMRQMAAEEGRVRGPEIPPGAPAQPPAAAPPLAAPVPTIPAVPPVRPPETPPMAARGPKPAEVGTKETGAAKEPWERLKDEYVNARLRNQQRTSLNRQGTADYNTEMASEARTAENIHRIAVEAALRDRRPISPEVLKDYPDLAAKPPALALPPIPGKIRPPTEGELSANPVFNPRFWEKADALIQPLAFSLERSIEGVFGKLPFSVRRWFQEDPQLKRIMHEARAEVGVQRSETDAVLRMVLKDKPTTEELVIADRIARGVPADLSAAKAPLQESVGEAAEYAHRVAQEITAERAAMGLPVRSDWLEGPKHWYPNFWQQHLFSPRMIAGRLFGFFRKGGAGVRPSAAEMGSLKARTTDRWVVVNGSGDVVKVAEGREAIFSKAEDAQAFLQANSGYKVRFFDVAERGLKETIFPSIGERTAWLESAGDSIHVREMLPGKHLRIVEPMTHEQMVAHGLIEDLTLNLRYGYGKERALLAKTRALQKLGQQLAIDAPQPGYVKLSETGFDIPAKLAERNPWIARLRDGYVPELAADSLNALYGRRGAWSNYFRAVEGTLRKWVTVYSPFRHPRNLIENYIPLAFRDAKAALDLPAMRVGFQDFVRGARGEKNVAFWEEYQGSGLATTDILRGEFETVWKTIDRVKPGNMELSVSERMGIWAETNAVARRLLKTRDFVQQMYRAEDQIWKYYYFRTLRERAWTPEAAAQRARRTFFDYEDVPPYVRAVNRVVPFVPNITFQYARILLSALRDDPASTPMKLGLLMYGYAFMREKAMEAAGITDQDEANMDRVGIKWHEFPLPMTDDKGRNLIVNLQWLIPFSEIELLRYSAAEEEPARGLAQAVRRFIPMAGQPVATAISQRGAFGQPILTGAEPRGEARKKLAREVAISALPGLLGQYWDRLYKNAAAGPEAKEPWGQRLAEGLVGNIQRIRSGERIGLRKALIAGEAREVQEEAGRQRGRLIRGRISGETFREEIGKLRKRSSEEAAAHPGTLAVVKALEEGRRGEAREEYQKLKDSEFYANSEEALQAIRDQLNRRGRLAELEKAPVVPARETVAAIVDEFRRTGRVNQGGRRMLKARLTALSESDQKAVLDYLEQQVGIARQEKARRVIPSGAGLPNTILPPIPR